VTRKLFNERGLRPRQVGIGNYLLKQYLESRLPRIFRDRIFNKQLPKFRLLARIDSRMIGHLGVEHRVVAVDGVPFNIFGVVGLCVHPDFRNRGVAGQLLRELEEHVKRAEISAIEKVVPE